MNDEYVLKSSVFNSIHNGDIDMGIVTTHEYYLLKKLSKKIDRRIQRVPAEDVQPVRHSQWKEWNEAGMYMVCASCGEPFSKLDVFGREQAKRFCSNCGANMREVPRE